MAQDIQKVVSETLQDCATVQQVANGERGVTVVSRLGEEMPTLTEALYKVIEAGGWEPFATEAALLASVPTIPKKAAKAMDTKKVWLWIQQAGESAPAWHDTGLSEKELAIIEFEKNIVQKNGTLAAFDFTDDDSLSLFRIGKDGGLYAVGNEGTIQEGLLKKDVRDSLKTHNSNDVFAISDNSDMLLLRVLNNGGLKLVGLDRTVQDLFKSTNTEPLNAFVSISKDLLKSNYSVDANAIATTTLNVDINQKYIQIDTPYRDNDDVVHPCIIQLDRKMRGYSYLMCITPYKNMNILDENPCIYGSNNLIDWELLNNIEQPLDNPPDFDEFNKKGFLSDCFWIYDHFNRELYCCYRKCYTHGIKKYNETDIYQLLYRKTKNGLNWSEPEQFFPDTLAGFDEIASPAIVYDELTQKWIMFSFDNDANSLYMRTNDDFRNIEGWSLRQEIGFSAFASATNIGGWHLDARFVGDRLFLLINDYRKTGNLYFAYADKQDLASWTFSAVPILSSNLSKGCYKATFITLESENGIYIKVYWTDSSANRKLYTVSSELLTIESI